MESLTVCDAGRLWWGVAKSWSFLDYKWQKK